ncbi:hypothetical protein LVW35_23560 [Pseudomonas sp. HN11]|uniref:hypothetical protein n=1 Tax=Pseudomonas sp. HN11 TaxID=1344094 RepID=UPI001F2A1F88|nr:hypothetical protein [Pseudomonas sp. HN11]UII70599.1 hypothetical protein LVW35_23560 [Pseudomonas sp. HN11]
MATNNPGDLDHTFGTEGLAHITQPGKSFFQVHGVTLTKAGKLLTPGSYTDDTGKHIYYSLGRRTHLGHPDNFGEGDSVSGRFTEDASLSSMGQKAFELENSRILLSGRFIDGTTSVLAAFARFDINGNPDHSFGENGRYVARSPLIPEYGSAHDPYTDACIQSHQYLLSINPYVTHHNVTTVMVRSTHDGRRDATFNNNQEYVDTRQYADEQIRLSSIATQHDDKIVTCGYTEDRVGIRRGIILRYEKDGLADSAFTFRREGWKPEHIIVVNERILCCGSTGSGEALLFELDTEGNLQGEPSITPINLSNRWTKMAWQDNKLVLIGERKSAFGSQLVVARFNNDRTLDRSFGTGGYASIDYGASESAPIDVTYDTQKGIVILASAKANIGDSQYYLARLFS